MKQNRAVTMKKGCYQGDVSALLRNAGIVEPPVDLKRVAAVIGVEPAGVSREDVAARLVGDRALDLLVPRFMFSAYARSPRATVQNMAALFGVSAHAIRQRATALRWPLSEESQ